MVATLAILTACAVALSGFLASLRSVPNLTGLTQTEAEALLAEVELVGEPVESAVTERLPDHRKIVVAQVPQPGAMVRSGDSLRFNVEPQELEMPDLAGLTWEEFEEKNEELHFAVLDGSEGAKKRHVIAKQVPGAGEKSTYGADVSLVLEVPQVEVPNLVGLKLQEAGYALASLGIEGDFKQHAHAVVRSQSITPGEMVDVHTSIELEAGLLVPDLVGHNREEATKLLRSAGIFAHPHEGSARLSISSQQPTAGSIISLEEAVTTFSQKHHKIYRVESNGSFGSITWGLNSITQDTNAALPWEHVMETDTVPSSSINLIAQTMDGTSITCKLIVDGDVVLEQTSTGPYAVVSCSRF